MLLLLGKTGLIYYNVVFFYIWYQNHRKNIVKTYPMKELNINISIT